MVLRPSHLVGALVVLMAALVYWPRVVPLVVNAAHALGLVMP